MRVLFLEIDLDRDWAVASIGPAFLAAFLRRHGHEAALLRIPLDAALSPIAEAVHGASAELLGVSLTSRQWLRGREVVHAIRERLDLPVVAGGLHPTFAPETVLDAPGFDYVCLGEGEEAMLELVQALEAHGRLARDGLRNIWVKGGPRPELRPPFAPVDALPFMARDILDEKYGVVHMVTQRGCPFPCTYCAARQFSDLYAGGYGNYGRRRSPESVLEELDQTRRHGELNYVIFLDDTFTLHHRWLTTFCRLYATRFGTPFSIHARVETVDQPLIAQLAEAGCRHITYGVESGSERVRRDIMKRQASNRCFEEVFRWTRQAGILVTANYIIGTPGETSEDIEQTLALHEVLQPDDFGYFVFYPYPGTALFRLCQERGYLPENYHELPANHRQTILRLPELSPEEIDEYYRRFTNLRKCEHLNRLATTDPAHRQRVIEQVEDSAAKG